MALRETFTTALKESMKAGDQRRVSTVRMIQGLIKQRRESIALYKQGNRPELAQQEQEEIAVIESFLPKQMSDADAEATVKQVIAAVGAESVKDMGKVMAALKEKHAGQLDLAKASGMVKKLLS